MLFSSQYNLFFMCLLVITPAILLIIMYKEKLIWKTRGSLKEHKALSKSKKLSSAQDRLLANYVLKQDKVLDAQRINKKG